jgi:hypothetical protein
MALHEMQTVVAPLTAVTLHWRNDEKKGNMLPRGLSDAHLNSSLPCGQPRDGHSRPVGEAGYWRLLCQLKAM